MMFGVLTIAVRIYHDRWGYGVYSGPIGTAVLIIATKWVRTCASLSGRAHLSPVTPPPWRLHLPPISGLQLKHRDSEHQVPPPHRHHLYHLDLTQVTPLLCLSFHI